MWYLWLKNMKGVTEKVEILHRGQSDPALQKTSNNFFLSRPLLGANGGAGANFSNAVFKMGIEP